MDENPLLLRALRQEPIERYPVWMMRQAGRYLPDYRALKARYSFSELCMTPELSVEAALQPIRIFGFDAAILFSDIMIPAKALGFGIDFAPGPVVMNPISHPSEVENLPESADLSILAPVFDALRTLKRELRREALIGFAATPFTLACYLLAQKPFKHFERSLIWARQHESAFKSFLEKLTELTEAYTVEQVKSGAQIIQLFDSWGAILPPEIYREFSLEYSNRIFRKLKSVGAHTILYVNGASPYLELLSEHCVAQSLSVDSRCSLSRCETYLPQKGLQGNLDASSLFSPNVAQLTEEMLRSLTRKTGYVANLGHGVLQETPVEGVHTFVDTVKNFSLR